MQVGVGKIVGRVGGSWWVQVHDFSKTKDRLVAVVTLKRAEQESEIEIVERGREVLTRLHELYFGNTEHLIYDRLKKAVEKILSEDKEIELACAAISNDLIYFVLNSGAVWSTLGQKEGWIISNQKTEELKFSSGKLQPGQTLLLGNRLFWDNLPQGMVKVADVETLSAVICGNEKEEGAAGLLMRLEESFENVSNFEEKEEENVETPIQVSPSPKKNSFWDRLKPNEIYISHESTPNSKQKLWLGIGVLVFLLISTFLGMWRKSGQDFKESTVAKQIEAVSYKFNEAKAVVSLNPSRSRQLLIEVKDLLTELRTKSDQKEVFKIVLLIEKEYQSIYEKSIGVVRPDSVEVIDLTLTRDGLRADKMVFVDGRIVGLDLVNPRLFSIDPKKKSVQMMAGPADLGKPLWLTSYPGKIIIGTEKSLVVCPAFQGSCVAKGISDVATNVLGAEMFSSNLYLLNTNGIWKYQNTDSGFGNKQAWLSEPDKVSLTTATAIAIDGSVWLIRDEDILKFIRGTKQEFLLTGLDRGWDKKASIFTGEDEKNLYVWDKLNSRIILINKDGKYLSQIINEDLAKAQSIAFDFSGKKIFLGVDNKIFEISL